jgi:beta-glucosidase
MRESVVSFVRRTTPVLAYLIVSTTVAFGVDQWDKQAQILCSRMTLEEKIGQMTQVDLGALKDRQDVQKYFLGSVLSGGGSDPANNLPETWRSTVDELQAFALKTRLKVPIIYGVDAVHGHNNINGAVIFPHNIGLGASRNPRLVERAAQVTAAEVAATGVHWAFAPCVAVARDIRWGRTYESFGESPDLAGTLGAAAVRGLQTPMPGGFQVMASAKHFAGDGGTENGVDQGNTVADEATFRKMYLAPYLPSIRAGAATIMVSYNSWNGQKLHGDKYLLTDVLKGEFGYKGFLISDWAAIDQLPGDYKSDIEQSINAGLDMVMIPNGPDKENNYVQFVTYLGQLVKEGRVPQARIDDAVTRILRAKFKFGVFAHPYAAPSENLAQIGSPAHRKVARDCVRESLVLLKNESNALPLSRKLPSLAVVGRAADDLGIQCGGWTIDWQGKTGPLTRGGTTILTGLRREIGQKVPITFSADGSNLAGAHTVLVVLGEQPYAEMKGDRSDLSIAPEEAALVAKAKASGARVVTLIISGRPLVLGTVLDNSDAIIAAWLPGTEGQGVADVLTGTFKPRGKLPHYWPRSAAQFGQHDLPDPQFPLGFGLTY